VPTKQHGRNDTAKWRHARQRAIRSAHGRCQLCQSPLDPTAPAHTPDTTEVDHIVPLSHGGDPYAQDNLRAVHRRCHQKRDSFDHRGWFNGNWYDGCTGCPHSEQW
jgi:5-methylcytosine-specific restriction endonuclease McrA